MLSYQHGYHAGNFADVLKHIALTRLLAYMTQKDKPMFYLETHSGKGFYDLKNKQAEKTGEYKQGIQPIWEHRKKVPSEFQEYLKLINDLNKNGNLHYYPGSPAIAINQLRTEDRLYFCELHSREFESLNQLPCYHKKVHFSHSDGITAMNALLPPQEKRGLIFIDPSFERTEEYKEIPTAINKAYSRFTTGVFCLWYPVVNRWLVDKLIRNMKAINAKNCLRIEFNLTMEPTEGMTGNGLLLINTPYTFAEEMKNVCETLKIYFNPGVSSYLIEAY